MTRALGGLRKWPWWLHLLGAAAFVALAFWAVPRLRPPTGAAASAAAAAGQCQQNLRALSLAAELYVQDYGALPPSARWQEALAPYAPGRETFRCPAAPGEDGYGFNAAAASPDAARSPGPAGRPLLFDGAAPEPGAADGLAAFVPRHPGGGFVAYLDGHVRLEPAAPLPGETR